MFLTEKELKDAFWKSYNNKGRAVKWQFECPVREGNTDLMTLEKKCFYRQKEIYLTAIKAGSWFRKRRKMSF